MWKLQIKIAGYPAKGTRYKKDRISGATLYKSKNIHNILVVTHNSPGSTDPPEKIFNIFASENEVYTIY